MAMPSAARREARVQLFDQIADLGEAVRQRKLAGLTVEPELLAHILFTDEYQCSKRR